MGSRGKFIVIEGADGVGSTTQSKLLVDALIKRGMPAIYTAEPSDREIGKFTRSSIRGGGKFSEKTLALLFAADRLDHYESVIEPALRSGVSVVSDRYILSSLAYQTLGGTSVEWLEQVNAFAPAADHTFLISLPFEDAWARIATRISEGKIAEDVFDKREKQLAIHSNYSSILGRVAGIEVDGSGAPLEILSRVLAHLGFQD